MIYESKLNQKDHYLSQLQFKEGISDYFNCNVDKNVGSEENKKFKQTQEDNLKKSYKQKCREKEQSFEIQISRAKWRKCVQARGDMTCKGGCKQSDYVVCGCEGRLYWVDGNTKHVICDSCLKVSV